MALLLDHRYLYRSPSGWLMPFADKSARGYFIVRGCYGRSGKLLEEKQALYGQYKTLRQDMIAYQTAKQNVDRILGLEAQEQEQKQQDSQTR